MKRPRALAGLLTLVVLLIIGLAVHRAQALPEGPQLVGWDREGCAECHMLISDRHFAAQLQTATGEVLNFDDPGCLMTYVADQHPKIHALYFRDSRSGEWLSAEEAGFVPTAQSPMGYGLACVRKTSPGAISYSGAFIKVQHPGPAQERK